MENQVTIKNCEIKVGNKNFKIIDGKCNNQKILKKLKFY